MDVQLLYKIVAIGVFVCARACTCSELGRVSLISLIL